MKDTSATDIINTVKAKWINHLREQVEEVAKAKVAQAENLDETHLSDVSDNDSAMSQEETPNDDKQDATPPQVNPSDNVTQGAEINKLAMIFCH